MNEILPLYPVSAYDAPIYALVAVVGDDNVTCEVREAARVSIGPANEPQYAPVWRYLFTHRAENDPFLNSRRAFHTEELFFLFGHLEQLESPFGLPIPYVPSADEIQLSNLVMDYWTRFAAKGDPNGGNDFHWPRYTSDDYILQLDVTPAKLTGYHNPQCDVFVPITDTFCSENICIP